MDRRSNAGPPKRKPAWLKTTLAGGSKHASVRRVLRHHDLHTVCESAACPNRGECWGQQTATFMILGDACTRGCRFCAVPRASAPPPPSPDEPERVAAAAAELGIRYVVITSVTRDDLADGGAAHFAATVHALKDCAYPPMAELLIPDFMGADLITVLSAGPDVLAHNIEVPAALSGQLRHPAFSYERSLSVLAEAKRISPGIITKSSIMLGLGETEHDVLAAMADLRRRDVDILVLGQYLRPTLDNAPVIEYVAPEQFAALARQGEEMGFGFVAASPLARTSFRARAAYEALASRRDAETRPAQ